MYICIYMYISLYIYICICVYRCVYIYTHTYIGIYVTAAATAADPLGGRVVRTCLCSMVRRSCSWFILFGLMGWWSRNNWRVPEAWRCGRSGRRNSGSVHAVQHLYSGLLRRINSQSWSQWWDFVALLSFVASLYVVNFIFHYYTYFYWMWCCVMRSNMGVCYRTSCDDTGFHIQFQHGV